MQHVTKNASIIKSALNYGAGSGYTDTVPTITKDNPGAATRVWNWIQGGVDRLEHLGDGSYSKADKIYGAATPELAEAVRLANPVIGEAPLAFMLLAGPRLRMPKGFKMGLGRQYVNSLGGAKVFLPRLLLGLPGALRPSYGPQFYYRKNDPSKTLYTKYFNIDPAIGVRNGKLWNTELSMLSKWSMHNALVNGKRYLDPDVLAFRKRLGQLAMLYGGVKTGTAIGDGIKDYRHNQNPYGAVQASWRSFNSTPYSDMASIAALVIANPVAGAVGLVGDLVTNLVNEDVDNFLEIGKQYNGSFDDTVNRWLIFNLPKINTLRQRMNNVFKPRTTLK